MVLVSQTQELAKGTGKKLQQHIVRGEKARTMTEDFLEADGANVAAQHSEKKQGLRRRHGYQLHVNFGS